MVFMLHVQSYYFVKETCSGFGCLDAAIQTLVMLLDFRIAKKHMFTFYLFHYTDEA